MVMKKTAAKKTAAKGKGSMNAGFAAFIAKKTAARKKPGGVMEKKTGETYKSAAAKKKHEGKETPAKKRSELKKGS